MIEKNLNLEQWKALYNPILNNGELLAFTTCQETANYIKKYMPEVLEEDRCQHVWTTTAGADWSCTSTGYRVVDRMHHYVCRVPWLKLNESCMYYEEINQEEN